MINYIHADLRRIFHRIPRLIVFALIYILVTVAFTEASKQTISMSIVLIAFGHYVAGAIPLIFGLVELGVVFSDDLSAKSMQSAIGLGINRKKVVLVKLADMAILVFLDILLFGLILTVTSTIGNFGLTGYLLKEFVITLLCTWLKTTAYLSLSMILAFYLQNALFAILVHIALATGFASKALGILFGIKFVAPLHLERFLLTVKLDTLYTQTLLGYFNIGALIAVIIYIAAGTALTTYLFSGIEPEL